MIRRRNFFVAAVGVATLVTTGPLAAAQVDRVITREQQPTSVTAYGGRIVWSRFVADDRYVLMSMSHDRVIRVPVASRRVPFDVDLGPDSRGRTIAVYSRCRREPSVLEPWDTGLPIYNRGIGCRLFRFDFSRRRESRITTGSPRGRSAVLPTVWGSRIGFVESSRAVAQSRNGVRAQLILRNLASGRRVRLRNGSANRDGNRSTGSGAVGPGALSLELRRTAVGVIWQTEPRRCGRDTTSVEGYVRSEVRLLRPSGSSRLIDAVCSGAGAYFTAPAFRGNLLHYLAEGNLRRGGEAGRTQWRCLNLSDGRRESTTVVGAAGPIAGAFIGRSAVLARLAIQSQSDTGRASELVALEDAPPCL